MPVLRQLIDVITMKSDRPMRRLLAYYGLLAVLKPVYNPENWIQPQRRHLEDRSIGKIQAAWEAGQGVPPPTYVFRRGNLLTRGAEVQPGTGWQAEQVDAVGGDVLSHLAGRHREWTRPGRWFHLPEPRSLGTSSGFLRLDHARESGCGVRR